MRNPVQTQKGLGLTEFQAHYGTEEQCRAAVPAWRWPKGFVCPHCGSTGQAIVGKRRLFLCHDCLTQASLKAGTILARTLLPLGEHGPQQRQDRHRRHVEGGRALIRLSLPRRVPVPLQSTLPLAPNAASDRRHSHAFRLQGL